MSLLVDVDEVRGLVRGPEAAATSPRRTARASADQRRRRPRKLIVGGHLQAPRPSINPINQYPNNNVIVTAEEVERFARYSRCSCWRSGRGQHFRKVKRGLDAAGIKPALDPAKVGATVLPNGDLRGWAPSSS